jgi:glycosyltransferase involved in cell wall biosynthesis
MRVFFDEQIFVHQAEGGISRYFTELGKGLASGGMAVRIFAGFTRNRYLDPLRGIPGLSASYFRRRDRLRINKAAARASRIWRRWDFARQRRCGSPLIYHATNYEVDAWAARRADATVLTIFDMIGELFGDERSRARSLSMKRHALGLADAAFCISERTKLDVQELLPGSGIPLEVTRLASSLQAAPCEALGVARKHAPYILLVGNRHGYKNGLAGLQAFARLSGREPEIRAVCFGGEPFNDEEKAALGASWAAGRVVQVQGEDSLLAAYYSEAVAMVYPSRYEGFGLPVLEAMQLGCPVIMTRCASLPEVGGAAGLYVEPDDVPGIAEAIEQLLRNEKQRRQWIEAGQLQASRFSWSSTAVRTRVVYEEILGRKGEKAG